MECGINFCLQGSPSSPFFSAFWHDVWSKKPLFWYIEQNQCLTLYKVSKTEYSTGFISSAALSTILGCGWWGERWARRRPGKFCYLLRHLWTLENLEALSWHGKLFIGCAVHKTIAFSVLWQKKERAGRENV